MSRVVKWVATAGLSFMIMGLVVGCKNGACSMSENRSTDEKSLDNENGKKVPELTEPIHHVIYKHLNLIQVQPKTPEYHANMLTKAQDPCEAAYHIIAIGLLREDTPEVRAALVDAEHRFFSTMLPQRYDWPDLAEKFKEELRENPKCVVDHYPGNRHIAMRDLIWECARRLNVKENGRSS